MGQVAEDGGRDSFSDRLAGFLADSWAAVLDEGCSCLSQDQVYRRRGQLPAQQPGTSLQGTAAQGKPTHNIIQDPIISC